MPARKRIVFRRKGSPFWHYRWHIDGVELYASTRTDDRETAQRIALKAREDHIKQARLGTPDRTAITLDGAFGRYWEEHARHLSYAAVSRYYIRALIDGLGKDRLLHHVTDDDLARYVAVRRSSVGNATVNRELSQFRAMNRRARELWNSIPSPAAVGRHLLQEPAHRTRYLDRAAEAENLLAACAEHLRPIVVAALATGLRRGNLLALDWSQVDLRHRVITVRVKDRKPGGKVLTVPIIPALLGELTALGPKTRGPVFTLNGNPVGSVKTAFNAACRRAGIRGFRFHDLRHTAASWLVQAGVPLDVVRDILGHADVRTTMRYAHRQAEAKRQAMEAALGTGTGGNWHNGPAAIEGGHSVAITKRQSG
jgi:integrase